MSQKATTLRPVEKNKTIIMGLVGIAMILFAYVIKRQVLIPFVALFFCGTIITTEIVNATYLLLLITPLSHVIVYRGITYFIFIVAAYVLLVVSRGLYVKGVFFLVSLITYSIVFANGDVVFKPGTLTSIIYILLVVFICDNIERKNITKALNYSIEGFAISTVIGLFLDKLPAMKEVFYISRVVADGEILDQGRFEGLAGDPNIYTAANCVAISALLFSNKKLNVKQILLICFLVIVGFFTYSKSYILTIAVIALVYMLKSGRHVVRNLLLLVSVGVVFIVIERYINLNVLDILLSRFDGAENADDLTTGRLDLWVQYIQYIFSDIKIIFFGDGFNSLSIPKAAHNTYIEMFFRYGFFGCVLWGFAIAMSVKSIRRRDDGEKAQVVTIIPLLVFIVVYLFLSGFTHGHIYTHILWVLFAMYKPDEEEENAELEYSSADLQRPEVFEEVY